MVRSRQTMQSGFSGARAFGALSIGVCAILLTACWGDGGSTSNGQLNIVPDSFRVKTGASVAVPFELVGSTGLVNQVVRFRVSDTSIAQVSPAHCVISSNAVPKAGCVLTVTGKRKGAVRLIAEADGYAADESAAEVDVGNGVGTVSIDTYSENPVFSYYQAAQMVAFSFTVRFAPSSPATTTVDANNPITVAFTDTSVSSGPSLVTYSPAPQCAVSTNSPTCIVSGYFVAGQVPSAGFTVTAKVVGTWQTPGQPFANAPPISIAMTPNAAQGPGTITVALPSGSNQAYAGASSPLLVNLTGNTLTQATYTVGLTIQNPSPDAPVLAFYRYATQSTSGQPSYGTSKTCTLNVDNSSFANYQANTIASCGFELRGNPGGKSMEQGAAIPIAVTVTSLTPGAASPTSPQTVYVQVDPPAQSPIPGRTVTFKNDSSQYVVFGSVIGTVDAYVNPTTSAVTPTPTVLGTSVACGPSAMPAVCPVGGNCAPMQACPSGSSCAQGGANVGSTTPWQCYWDAPVFSRNPVGSGEAATVTVPGYAGIMTGTNQRQWSGKYYALSCPRGAPATSCPSLPVGYGVAPTGAYTGAEITYLHNTVDFYDVTLITGVSNGLSFGPSPFSGKRAGSPIPGGGGSITTPYACGTAGLRLDQSGTTTDSTGKTITVWLPAAHWNFAPSAASFPQTSAPSDSPASYFAYVAPSNPTKPTPCTTQSYCENLKTSDSVCGWNFSGSASAADPPFSRVCGTFQAWGSAYGIQGWPQPQNPASGVFQYTQSVGNTTVGTLQYCLVPPTYSSYATNPPVPVDPTLACGGTNWAGILSWTPVQYTTANPNWQAYVLPTITWLKQACPTCYAFPFDDATSTFNCEDGTKRNSGHNILDYQLQVDDIISTFN